MHLTIDNFDGGNARDYTAGLDSDHAPRVKRQLNRPAQLRAWLIADGPQFIVPVEGARVLLTRDDGTPLFTGYISATPGYEYLGWAAHGPVYRYAIVAFGDEWLLDSKTLPRRAAFVNRTAGSILKQMAEDLAPGAFNTTAVQDAATLAFYSATSQRSWSEHAAEVAVRSRASYRAHNGTLRLEPIGAVTHVLDEADTAFSRDQLQLASSGAWANDATLIGRLEPRAYVKDYFLGDGFNLRFYLSSTPFTRSTSLLLDEEFRDAMLRPEWWSELDPSNAVFVSQGRLRVEGGTGTDGSTLVTFAEQLEMGGALILQHGDVNFTAASSGILGGLYNGAQLAANCVAGFQITPNGTEVDITAFINGAVMGTPLTTVAGRRYVLTTRTYARENYRRGQTFHSSAHPAGSGRGNMPTHSELRVVLEAHEIDPNNPASLISPSTVLYDDVLPNTPEFCTYALVNAVDMHCAIAFTRLLRTVDAEVRSALPGQPYRTRLVGGLAEGSECRVTQDAELWFFSAHVPADGEKIVVRYRSRGRAQARLVDPSSVAAESRGPDSGLRGVVRFIAAPAARTSRDCQNAVLALLDDATQTSWSGEYATWSDFLPPGSSDVFPGDAIAVHAPSRSADFTAIVREVEIEVAAHDRERFRYHIVFASDAAELLALSLEPSNFFPPDPLSV
ncbi:MAG: hypothetical protein AB7O65_13090, partial [Candidatus Korobacteraceae bacterium]